MRKKATNKQKAYINEYNKANYKAILFKLHKSHEPKMIEYLETVGNVNGYIKSLIAADMKAHGIETDE